MIKQKNEPCQTASNLARNQNTDKNHNKNMIEYIMVFKTE